MMKNKIRLVESTYLLNSNRDSEVIEDLNTTEQPNFSIVDVTVIPDEEYQPTIQNILIDLEESEKLHESKSNELSINILSETVNSKTGYSMSLFEFAHGSKVITLSLTLCESDIHTGVFNVSAYTTMGEKVFETNTQTPKKVVESYLKSLSSEYLVESENGGAE